MKKILAIAIALVMVFAIASTAFAAIGFPKVGVPSSGVSLDVVGLTATTGVLQTAASTYLRYDQTQGVVAGTPVTFMCVFTIARQASPSARNLVSATNIDIQATNLEVGAGGALGATITGYTVNAVGTTVLTNAGPDAAEIDDTDFAAAAAALDADLFARWTWNNTVAGLNFGDIANRAKSLYLLVEGYQVDETKDATVTLTWRGVTSTFAAGNPITIKNAAGKSYEVTKTANPNGVADTVSYAVLIPTGAYAGWVVTFYGDGFDGANYDARYTQVSSGANAVGTIAANTTLTVAMNNTIVDMVTGLGAPNHMLSAADPTAYAAYKAAFDEVVGIFGWSFNGTLNTYLNDAGFEAYAGSTRTQRASWTYYAYTNALTVSGTAAVPDTGDMSVVGIALVVVAVIAAAAVAIKKVRA